MIMLLWRKLISCALFVRYLKDFLFFLLKLHPLSCLSTVLYMHQYFIFIGKFVILVGRSASDGEDIGKIK